MIPLRKRASVCLDLTRRGRRHGRLHSMDARSDIMETMTGLQVKDALVERRRRLTQALERLPDTGRLSALLGEVDAALSRLPIL
jgi:hypothetical protein